MTTKTEIKEIKGNCGSIFNSLERGEVKIGDIVYSTSNNCNYRIVESKNHQNEWISLQEVTI